jgi:hypothetical protein
MSRRLGQAAKMASSFESELRATEVGAEKLSAFERLLQKYDIAHDFSPSVSPEQVSNLLSRVASDTQI